MSIALWLLAALGGGLTVGGLLAGAIVLVLRRSANPHSSGARSEGLPVLGAFVGVAILAVVGLIGVQSLSRSYLEPILCSWVGEEEMLLVQVRIESQEDGPPPVYLSGDVSGYLRRPTERRDDFWVWELPTDSAQVETFSGELIPAFPSAGSVTVFLDPDFGSVTERVPTCHVTYHGP